MNLPNNVFVLNLPGVLNRFTARKIAMTVPAQAEVLLLNLDSNLVITQNGADELFRSLLQGNSRRASVKGWAVETDVHWFVTAAEHTHVEKQFTW